MRKIPLTLDARSLARLLSPLIYKGEKTILRDLTRSQKKSLPPFEILGGLGGKKIFDTQRVIDFYPADIGAAIRRALVLEYENKTVETPVVNSFPELRSLAEDLLVAATTRSPK